MHSMHLAKSVSGPDKTLGSSFEQVGLHALSIVKLQNNLHEVHMASVYFHTHVHFSSQVFIFAL